MNIRSRKKISINVLFVRTSCLSLLLAIPCSVSLAQTITSSGLNTSVSAPIALPSGQTQFDITGGTRPGGGGNLFHSFGNFNVSNNNIANFLNNSGLPTSNILGRINGGNVSNIFGTIQTTGFGGANLFLMNPAGFLFGPNATLNVGGMVAFTSADYLRLADNARFNAVTGAADALLTAAPVAAFGFLGSNPGVITVQGSQLSVAENTGISLVGGNITVEGGTLTAPSGQINLVSVGKPSNRSAGGEVVVPELEQGLGFTPTGFRSLGTINLSQSTIDVSSLGEAGSVVIRGGQLVMDGGAITARGHAGSIILESRGDLVIRTSTLAAAADIDPHGTVDLKAGTSINLTDTDVFASALHGSGSITMAAPIISLRGSRLEVSADTFAGIITLSATRSVNLSNGTVLSAGADFGGVPGSILINGGNQFTAQESILSVSSFRGSGGTIRVQANKIGLADSQLMTNSLHSVGGNIALDAECTTLTNSQITSSSFDGHGGAINLTSPRFNQDASSVIDASSQIGANGTVTINGVIQP
jgi:filamentous hemagglutinin family protein